MRTFLVTGGAGFIGSAFIRLLLESTAEGIYGVDTNGNCTFCNPSGLRMLGYGKEEDLIGRNMHEDPNVPNYGTSGKGPRLEIGMVLAIEPMVNAGGAAVDALPDGWTVVTRDGSLSAHFEHTVAITADGPLVLTLEE